MPICDGSNCSAKIPWRITKSSLQLSNRAEKFKLSEVKVCLNRVIKTAYGGCSLLNVGVKEVVFKNYCEKCWLIQANKWGDVGTYRDARAKTDATGIYFQVASPSFINNHTPNLEKIFSCVCHELMHSWSFNCKGLQDFNRNLNVDWDEAVADLLGFLTYKSYFRGRLRNYITPYNNYPKCIDRAGESFMDIPKYKWNRYMAGGDERNRLPNALREAFEEQGGQANSIVMKSKTSNMFREILFESLVRWFFTGPHNNVPSMGTTCREFLTQNGIQGIINTSYSFPAYAGYDTAHVI